LLAGVGTEKMGIFPGDGGKEFTKKPITTITAPATYLVQVFDANKDNKTNDLLLWYIQPEEEGTIRLFLAKE
ncbi:MAG: hypothetical protein GY864_13945, partial [Desulfobacterales bacterium]|nr:hypothetical protein [Desulfobacterales bacterium]